MYICLCTHREYKHLPTFRGTETERDKDTKREREKKRERTYIFIFLQIQFESRNTLVTVNISRTQILVSEYTLLKRN